MTNKTNRNQTDDFVIAVFVEGETIPASDNGRETDATCQNPSGRRIHHDTGCFSSRDSVAW